ncbi:glycosylated lysosomal membrane protein isoform X2 [Hemibagrus wyckioides]|uniref:glycosylated lysosomal membrane protein isoform X2 n=1 Tax=Hemibagrus wyckioides TaxID=337641 RepID=UPI00266D6BE2|nr:glycosylated lysosomal membrane protein isoform X2 [Hemibagrus wyckioides]
MSAIKTYYSVYFTLFLIVYYVDGFVWHGDTFTRKVSLEMNPGLTPPHPPHGVSMLHARALGRNDTLHFLLCSGGAPALMLIHTHSTESTLKVNWTKFVTSDPAGSVKVEPESSVQYRGALVFTRLWEYDELNTTGQEVLSPYELQDFDWEDVNQTVDYTHHTAELCGRHAHFSRNASLCLHFSLYESSGRDGAWPSLLHNANSSQLRILLNNVMPRTNQSHFGLELQTVSEASEPGLQTHVHVHRSIDDEYTPSIFQVSEWVWPHDNSSSKVGFSQWKPVMYKKSLPAIEDAAPCSHSEPVSLPQAPPSRIIPACFTQNPLTHGLNVTFNMTTEPTPNSTHFLSCLLPLPLSFFCTLSLSLSLSLSQDHAGGNRNSSVRFLLSSGHRHHGHRSRHSSRPPRGRRSFHLCTEEKAGSARPVRIDQLIAHADMPVDCFSSTH